MDLFKYWVFPQCCFVGLAQVCVFMCIVYVHVLVLLLEIHIYAQPHAQFDMEPWSCGSLPSIGMLDLTHLLYAFTYVAYSLKSVRIHKINTDIGLKM